MLVYHLDVNCSNLQRELAEFEQQKRIAHYAAASAECQMTARLVYYDSVDADPGSAAVPVLTAYRELNRWGIVAEEASTELQRSKQQLSPVRKGEIVPCGW